MHDPVTKLGVVRRITYFPDRRLLRAVTADGGVHEVSGVEPERVEAAQPFDDPAKIERLIDQAVPWRRVSGPMGASSSRPPAATPPAKAATGRGKRMAGRFISPLGLVQSVTYDRVEGRLRLFMADGDRFESRRVAPEDARALGPVRTRVQFDRLYWAGGEWRRLAETS